MNNETKILENIQNILQNSEKEAGKKSAALIVVGGELNGTLFELIEKKITAGRNFDNLISLELEGISRVHFTIFSKDNKTHMIQDDRSKNGTYINNHKISCVTKLCRGDIIKIGTVALKYLPYGDPERLTYDKLHHKANIDQHTKCFNKAYFNDKIKTEVTKAKVTGIPLSLIMFDIDHFKQLNDRYGHAAGDLILSQIADIMRQNGVREQDIFARYGGEEFVILLPAIDLEIAFEIAERLRKHIAEYVFLYEDKKISTTISMGVADYRDGVYSSAILFKRADQALYKAKNLGRNQVRFFKES